jgi:hypothetical protein
MSRGKSGQSFLAVVSDPRRHRPNARKGGADQSAPFPEFRPGRCLKARPNRSGRWQCDRHSKNCKEVENADNGYESPILSQRRRPSPHVRNGPPAENIVGFLTNAQFLVASESGMESPLMCRMADDSYRKDCGGVVCANPPKRRVFCCLAIAQISKSAAFAQKSPGEAFVANASALFHPLCLSSSAP